MGRQFPRRGQNPRLVASAERYYRLMYYGGSESWNLRDTHMFETLEHVLNPRSRSSTVPVPGLRPSMFFSAVTDARDDFARGRRSASQSSGRKPR